MKDKKTGLIETEKTPDILTSVYRNSTEMSILKNEFSFVLRKDCLVT